MAELIDDPQRQTRETDNRGNIKTRQMKQMMNKIENVEMLKKDNNRKSVSLTSHLPCLWFNTRNMKQKFQMKKYTCEGNDCTENVNDKRLVQK